METVEQPVKTPPDSTASDGRKRSPSAAVRWAKILLSLGLAAVFLASGGAKILDPAAFQKEILQFQSVSIKPAGLLALYLPWLELFCGVALLTRFRLGATCILAGLMVIFIGAVALAWTRGLDVTCGCFGSADSAAATSYPLWIARNLLILAGLGAFGWLTWKAPARARKTNTA